MTCDECGYPDHATEGIQVTDLEGELFEFCSYECLYKWVKEQLLGRGEE